MKSAAQLILLLTAACLQTAHAWANDVDSILKSDQPAGVVFEIIASDKSMLETGMPQIKRDIERLRKVFPELPIAIVSHGKEQFSLTSSNSTQYKTAHGLVEQLVKRDDVQFHVCGTHASWYNVMPEDFPDYVDVSAAGPAQINDYEELGYELIVIDR